MMEIICWVEPNGEPYTQVEHTLLKAYSGGIESYLKHHTFTNLEYLLYPELEGLDLDTDGETILEPNFSFIKGLIKDEGGMTTTIKCEDGTEVEECVFNSSLFCLLQGVETYGPYKLVHIGDGLDFTTYVYHDGIEVGKLTHGFSSGYTYSAGEIITQLRLEVPTTNG